MQGSFEKDRFSNLEWELMLNAGHIKRYTGFLLPHRVYSDMEILSALEHLVRKGILNSDGEQFYLNDTYRERMLYLKQPKKIVKVYARDNVVRLCCCYKRESYFVTEPDSRREDGMKTAFYEKDEWLDYLEEVFLSKLPNPVVSSESWMEEEAQNQLWDVDCLTHSFEQNMKRENIMFQLECTAGTDAEVQCRIIVTDEALFPVFHMGLDSGEQRRVPLERNILQQELKQLFAEEKNDHSGSVCCINR